jgi:ketosteroid isomerase-like protein
MTRLLLLPLLLIALPLLAQTSAEKEVLTVLERSVSDWNRGDVKAFMSAYANSPETTFAGKAGVTRGHRQVLENYMKRYPSKDAMGTVAFSQMEVHMMAPGAAWVLGHWNLKRTTQAGGNVDGIFTLILRKTPNGWKIIHDHTS